MLNVEIYIQGDRLDLFKDETISLVDSIKNSREPEKAFTGFTKEFSVPASKTNNKAFKHFYNEDIVNGFDGRVYVSAEIYLNTILFKSGNVKLNSVKLQGNKATSYSITFYDYLVNLSQLIGSTKLSNLSSLESYSHDYNLTNVKMGFEHGIRVNSGFVFQSTSVLPANIVYPFISHTKQYAYDSSGTPSMFDFGVFADTGVKTALQYTQLSPAIRFVDILSAIEDQFGITFANAGFLDDSVDEYKVINGMYLWLHTDKGGVVNPGDKSSFIPMESFTLNSGTDVTEGGKYIYQPNFFGDEVITPDANITLLYDVTSITGTGNYDITIKNGYTGNTLFQQTNNSGLKSFSVVIPKATGDAIVYPQFTIDCDSGITAFNVRLTATRNLIPGSSSEQGIYLASSTTVSYVSILANMPDISVIDFLKGMFMMFNLTIEYNSSSDEYEIYTLDQFYSNGSTIDLSKYIDVSDSDILPTAPYNKISFKWSEAKTYLMERRYGLLGERYGDDSYDLTGIFNGDDYDIKLPFEKILFERMEDLNPIAATNPTNNLWAWCVDSSENAISTKPIVFYCDRATKITGADIDWDGTTSSTSYLLCSNTIKYAATSDYTALGFKNEIGENTLETQDESLFSSYWETYITGVYNYQSRIKRIKAILPVRVLTSYKLNDTIVFQGKEYFINEIEINLNTGEAEIELITKWL